MGCGFREVMQQVGKLHVGPPMGSVIHTWARWVARVRLVTSFDQLHMGVGLVREGAPLLKRWNSPYPKSPSLATSGGMGPLPVLQSCICRPFLLGLARSA